MDAPRFVLLWTDAALFVLVCALLVYGVHVRRDAGLSATWRRVFTQAPALCSALVLAVFLAITLLDSVHFRRALPPTPGAAPATMRAYDTRTESLLGLVLAPLLRAREASYSMPLAYQGFTRESALVDGRIERTFPRLRFGGAHLQRPHEQWLPDVVRRTLLGAAGGALLAALTAAAVALLQARREALGWRVALRRIAAGDTALPLRAALLTLACLCVGAGMLVALAGGYHVLGTDRTGNDVLAQALGSVRTAFVIGSLATLATLPLALLLGVAAGYVGGWVDELIQYLYTTLSSVPNVLLISACVLMMQVFIDQHPEAFETGAERADAKLLLLCLILGLSGWTGLARLIRGETLKLRQLEYVQAAAAFGVGAVRIMARHIVPNVAHLVLITTVLEFSGLILYEAVLSYIGVGVDPSMNSFGGMINLARSEMSRSPVVWWSIAAAFVFMVALVLAANLFADGVRDAFDPRAAALSRRARAARVPSAGATQ